MRYEMGKYVLKYPEVSYIDLSRARQKQTAGQLRFVEKGQAKPIKSSFVMIPFIRASKDNKEEESDNTGTIDCSSLLVDLS